VRGYTRFTNEHGDEAAARLADRFAALCESVVSACGGQVLELRGDEALCVFNSARDALRGSVALQTAFKHAVANDPTLPVNVGIGLDAGDAIPVRGGYRGGALNLAARLCSIAGAGEILASEGVIHLARKMDGLAFVDRGQVTLKGLESPVRVLQIARDGDIPADLPPLQPILVTHPTNLPDDSTPFVGREEEIAAIAGLVWHPHIRLVTLTGPGGTGKTRLALQVGTTLLYDFPDGVFFCDLSPLADSALVPSAIAQVLDVKEQPGRHLTDTLTDALKEKHLLLVLDNFEHVIDACSAVADFLDGCRNLRILVTSRIPLHLSREQEHAVPPLSLPDPHLSRDAATLSRCESVALFIQRAKAVKDSFSLTDQNASAVAEICSRLDGLPLAIELAAARIKLFPPQALLQRLDSRLKLLTGGARDRPSRQQTLRGAIDWSYQLLSAEERVLFARLSVFAGGCTLDTVEAICESDGGVGIDAIDGVASLVEKSLVRRIEDDASDEPRFALLETIREYAGEKLEERGEADAIRERHFRHFTELGAMGYGSVIGGSRPGLSVVGLARENDNVIAALRWAIDRRDVPGSLRLAAYLCMVLGVRGQWHEVRMWRDEALSMAPPGQFPAEHGLMLLAAGILSTISGETNAGIARLLEAQELLEQGGDRTMATRALLFAGMQMGASGDVERGTEHLNRGLGRAREIGDSWAIGEALSSLAHAAMVAGDYALARRNAEEAVAWLPRVGETYTLAHAFTTLGHVSRLERAYAQACEHYERALAVVQDLGWSGLQPSLRHNVAWALRGLGDDEAAIHLFTATAREFQQMGDIRGLAECLVGLACTAREVEFSARLFGSALTLLGDHEMALSYPNQHDYAQAAARVRAALGEEAWQTAWTEGARLTPDQALALAQQSAAV
jgi:predicted ATPase